MTSSASHEPADVARRTGWNVPVLIAGAGIGGLATALALARHRIPSRVFERRSDPGEDGAGIQIGPNGTRILADLGVAESLIAAVAVPDSIRVMDGLSGDLLSRLPLGRWIEARHGAPYWVAHRRDLHGALLAQAQRCSLISLETGVEIRAADPDAAGVCVTDATGATHTGHGFVAADGLWSKMRGTMPGVGALRAVGKMAVRTTVPRSAAPPALQSNDVMVWMRPQAHVVHYPVRGSDEIALIGVFPEKQGTEGWSSSVEAAAVQQLFADFPAPLRTMIAAGSQWRKWSLYGLPASHAWRRGPIALLGDAAHPVLPFLAQGAVLALEDAAVIAGCLAQYGDAAIAFAHYEEMRWRRAQQVTAASRRNDDHFHVSGLLAAGRNAVLRTLPGTLLMARYDWLYGWRPDSAAVSAGA